MFRRDNVVLRFVVKLRLLVKVMCNPVSLQTRDIVHYKFIMVI